MEFNKPKSLNLVGDLAKNFDEFQEEVPEYFEATETVTKSSGKQPPLKPPRCRIGATFRKQDNQEVETIYSRLNCYVPTPNKILVCQETSLVKSLLEKRVIDVVMNILTSHVPLLISDVIDAEMILNSVALLNVVKLVNGRRNDNTKTIAGPLPHQRRKKTKWLVAFVSMVTKTSRRLHRSSLRLFVQIYTWSQDKSHNVVVSLTPDTPWPTAVFSAEFYAVVLPPVNKYNGIQKCESQGIRYIATELARNWTTSVCRRGIGAIELLRFFTSAVGSINTRSHFQRKTERQGRERGIEKVEFLSDLKTTRIFYFTMEPSKRRPVYNQHTRVLDLPLRNRKCTLVHPYLFFDWLNASQRNYINARDGQCSSPPDKLSFQEGLCNLNRKLVDLQSKTVPVLSRLAKCIVNGWPTAAKKPLSQFKSIQDELNVEGGQKLETLLKIVRSTLVKQPMVAIPVKRDHFNDVEPEVVFSFPVHLGNSKITNLR
uniref:Uncharacterized protein n=1 Tax=Timema cristinae TaxID=61476 RepID=A0A7R9CSE0_TIMCR|nr:unnamed protein product [Timema cristinae]